MALASLSACRCLFLIERHVAPAEVMVVTVVTLSTPLYV